MASAGRPPLGPSVIAPQLHGRGPAPLGLFTHLHNHTEFSLLDGLSRIRPLVAKAAELGMDSLAITDHGALYGAIDFYRAAVDEGIKPIIGCEMYVARDHIGSRNPEERRPHHLTVLARNAAGYRNLVKLVTRAHLEGFYQKPRVDRSLLERFNDGLTVLSGCPSGELPRLIAEGRHEEARATAVWHKEVFGDYYLELMRHDGVPDLPAINNGLLRLHDETGIPLVATNDSHYVEREEAPLQDILICIHTNTNVNDNGRMRMEDDSYFLKSPGEMEALFADVPQAVNNTRLISESCDLKLDFDVLRLPRYQTPEGMSADEYLVELCRKGFERRVPNATSEDRERLDYELEVIRQTRFADYFLVVWDIARFVRQNDILLALRGSAAASLVLYCLDVTDVNPMKYGLVFERFLNVERKEMPDIDMDFQDDRRDEVINYVVRKYGSEHVAQIITFGTLGARAAIRDTGRALAMTYGDVDSVARLVPFRLNVTIDDALNETPEMAERYRADESVTQLIDTARKLEGLTRHSSTHAAGVVISQEPLDEVVPLQRPVKGADEGVTMTQYSMDPIADLGLLKIDFLGLANLTILDRVRKLIAGANGADLDLNEISLDDPKAFAMLSRGETSGVFQLEGQGMTRYIQDLKPSSLGDVAAMIALYRPGPMEHINTFIDAKFGRAKPAYLHEGLQDILEETYGVIVYQDQVLQIARKFAGYSLGEADIVRKAMGKKVPAIMAQEKEKFVSGAQAQGYTQELAERLFELIEPFAGYAFNKAHSVSYGLISYWTAYFKANYPAEYMVSLLNAYSGHSEKLAASVEEAQRLEVPVVGPDVNKSGTEFVIEEQEDGSKSIRFGLAAIKGIGAAAVQPLIDGRAENGEYESIEHMCRNAELGGLTRKTLETLIRAGAMDCFGSRAGLLEVVDRTISLAQSEAALRGSDQATMFEALGQSTEAPLARIDVPDIQAVAGEVHAWELDLLGVALSSGRALASVMANGDKSAVVARADLTPDMQGREVTVVGQISAVSHRLTKTQRPYAIATLNLLDGTVEVFVWENVLQDTQGLWETGKLVSAVASVRMRDDEVRLSCVSAQEYVVSDVEPETGVQAGPPAVATAAQNGGQYVSEGSAPAAIVAESANGPAPVPQSVAQRRLRLLIRESDQENYDLRMLSEVKRVLLDHTGADQVQLEIASGGRVVSMRWDEMGVLISDDLEQSLGDILGAAGQIVVEDVTV